MGRRRGDERQRMKNNGIRRGRGCMEKDEKGRDGKIGRREIKDRNT